MSRDPNIVDDAISRFDELIDRLDRNPTAHGSRQRVRSSKLTAWGRKLANVGMALGVLIAATLVFGVVVGPIGLTGLFVVGALMFLALILFSVWPADRAASVKFKEDMPNEAVVRRLDKLLVQHRREVPRLAAQRLDAISNQLPLIEARLSETNILDPIAQDARRLLGKHLPELLERYVRVPPAYRSERDGEGMTVDERLVAGLDAAENAIDDLSRKLAHEDLSAFETHGRFIESRYVKE
jgi:hypothetical protein